MFFHVLFSSRYFFNDDRGTVEFDVYTTKTSAPKIFPIDVLFRSTQTFNYVNPIHAFAGQGDVSLGFAMRTVVFPEVYEFL